MVDGSGVNDTFNTSGATNDWSVSGSGFNSAGCHVTGAASVTPSSASAQSIMVGFSLPSLGAVSTGNFSLTGNAATFSVAQLVSFASFALTGNAATFKAALPATQASFALTGNVATFKTAQPAAQASFALTGNAATFRTAITAVQASFAETGEPVTILITEPVSYGSFVLDGVAASGLNVLMSATYGSFSFVVVDATLKTTMELWTPASSGTEVWTPVGIN
jgi:hypothetical protein